MTTAALLLNEAFGERVRHELDSRSLSLRQGRIRTGIDTETLSRMRQGEVPRMDKVVAFARGFGYDPNDWLELAGYERLDSGGGSASDRLIEGWEALCDRHPDLDVPFPRPQAGARNLTLEEAESILKSVEERIERGGYPKRAP